MSASGTLAMPGKEKEVKRSANILKDSLDTVRQEYLHRLKILKEYGYDGKVSSDMTNEELKDTYKLLVSEARLAQEKKDAEFRGNIQNVLKVNQDITSISFFIFLTVSLGKGDKVSNKGVSKVATVTPGGSVASTPSNRSGIKYGRAKPKPKE